MTSIRFDIGHTTGTSLKFKDLEEQFSPTTEDLEHQYNPFTLTSIQSHQPIHNLFFTGKTDIQFNARYQMVNMGIVADSQTLKQENRPVFIKYSPLLDPIRYMIGKYDILDDAIRTLPNNGQGFSKLANTNNASYTDGFFSFLASKMLHTHGFKHSIDYYGAYLAMQSKFKMNIEDDYDYLSDSDFFTDNINKLFKITKPSDILSSSDNSRSNKGKLNISDEILLDDIIVVDDGICSDEKATEALEEVFKKDDEDDEDEDEEDEDDEDEDDEDEEDEDDDEDEDEDDEDDEDEESPSVKNKDESVHVDDDEEGGMRGDPPAAAEENVFAYIDNFPVHMICLEKCDGTIDQLFDDNEIDEQNGASALFQIIMSLLAFDKAFNFTHNDLHTNNIMYINTDIDYLYYTYASKHYKVPTYGKIFKLIDFGRSIYKFKGKLFCSDSFDTGGDAATQYNFPPFFNKKLPTIEPNESFDLCRLGCSIYDFVMDDNHREMNELQKTIDRWCKDDKGTSVLYKKNGEERYPDFKLYKMIARKVHKHTAKAQLAFPYFKQFLEQSLPDSAEVMDIDMIPDYTRGNQGFPLNPILT